MYWFNVSSDDTCTCTCRVGYYAKCTYSMMAFASSIVATDNSIVR